MNELSLVANPTYSLKDKLPALAVPDGFEGPTDETGKISDEDLPSEMYSTALVIIYKNWEVV